MKIEWVIGVYTGERAKSVKEHADAGIGYFIQKEEGRGVTYTVYAAFRRAVETLRPDHLELATPAQVEKLEKLYNARSGVREVKVSRPSSTAEMLGMRKIKS